MLTGGMKYSKAFPDMELPSFCKDCSQYHNRIIREQSLQYLSGSIARADGETAKDERALGKECFGYRLNLTKDRN